MTELEAWTLGWMIGSAVVVVAATLLIWILLVGWSLERQTARALRALEAIDRNTKPIWRLSSTAEHLEQVRADADAAESALAERSARFAAPPSERVET